MALVVEDGTGKADAESYASIAEADAFFAKHLYAATWTAATTAQKESALAMATRAIDASVEFKGMQTTATQALEWPRYGVTLPYDPALGSGYSVVTGNENVGPGYPLTIDSDVVPTKLKHATIEFTRFLLAKDRDTEADGSAVKREKVDVIEVEYSENTRPDLIPDFVLRLLRPFVLTGPSEGGGAQAQSFKLYRT